MKTLQEKIDSLFPLWQKEDGPGAQVLVRHKGEMI